MPSMLGIVAGTEEAITMSTERQEEINETYELMGLGSVAARAQYANWFAPEQPKLQFDVVITTTSNPYS